MRPFDPVRPTTVWALNVNMPLAVIRRFIFVCLDEKLLGTCRIFASERFSHPVSVRKIVPADLTRPTVNGRWGDLAARRGGGSAGTSQPLREWS